MRDTRYRLLAYSLAAVLVLGVSCTGNSLDDGDSPNVVLEVMDVLMPPVQAAEDATGTCFFTVTECTATIQNVPKSEFATTSPANDATIESLTISYTWDDGAAWSPYVTEVRVVIPADGSNQVKFIPAPMDALLNAVPARDGHSAEVRIVFRGYLEDGSAIQTVGGSAWIVNSCIPSGG